MWECPGLSSHDQSSWIFSLEKLLHHQEEKGEFKQGQDSAILLLQTCPWLSSSPSYVP